jgi:hypothetical protein
MNRTTSLFVTLGLLCMVAAPALADDAATQTAPGAADQTQTPSTQPAPATQPPPATQPAPATTAPADPGQPAVSTDAAAPAAPSASDALARIRDEGKKVDVKTDQKVNAALDAASNDVEKNVATDGDAKIATRLAAEFGTTPDALLSEKSDVKASWGQLKIAHSLLANGAVDLTTKQIFDLRGEGMSWGQIANGMGLHLGEVVKAAREEARVAKGVSQPDGKVAVVHGAGSKFEASSRSAKAEKAEKTAMKEAAKANAAKADAAKEAAPDAASTPAGSAAGGDGGKK